MSSIKNKSNIQGLAICLILINNLWATGIDWSVNRGSADYAELQIAHGVMSQARANSGVALVDPMENIATLSVDSTRGGHLVASRYLSSDDFAFEFQNISWYQDSKWGVHARFGQYEDLDGLDDEARSTAGFGAQIHDFALSYSDQYQDVHFGVNTHFLNSKIATASSQALYLDVGLWSTLLPQVDYGLIVGNLGRGSAYDNREITLPLYLQTGFAYALPLIPVFQSQVFADYQYQNDRGASYILGGKMAYQQFIAVHSAIPIYREDEELQYYPKSAGLEVIFENLIVNYAFQSIDELGASHHMGLEIKF